MNVTASSDKILREGFFNNLYISGEGRGRDTSFSNIFLEEMFYHVIANNNCSYLY